MNYYIQHDDRQMVMQVCKDATNADPSSAGDLWIQALTYFRDIPKIVEA